MQGGRLDVVDEGADDGVGWMRRGAGGRIEERKTEQEQWE